MTKCVADAYQTKGLYSTACDLSHLEDGELPMNQPPDVQVREDLHLLIWKPRGILNEKVTNNLLAFLADEEARTEANELRFVDTSRLTAVALNFRYVFHIALYRRLTRSGRPAIKSAFFIRNPEFAHYFKLHVVMTDYSRIKAKLFDNREAAAKWLKVPLEVIS